MAQTYAEQLLKRKYSSNQKVVNQSVVDTRFLRDIKRTVSPGGESWNSFLIISGGVGWTGTRTAAHMMVDVEIVGVNPPWRLPHRCLHAFARPRLALQSSFDVLAQ